MNPLRTNISEQYQVIKYDDLQNCFDQDALNNGKFINIAAGGSDGEMGDP